MRPKKDSYPTYAEAAAAAQGLGIKSEREYQQRYREDPRLPARSDRFYSDFCGWHKFLGKDKPDHYPTCAQAAAAAQRLGIKSQKEYRKRYTDDPRLPSTPERSYSDFCGWHKFLGKYKPDHYPTCAQAAAAAQGLGIKGQEDYKQRYRKDPRLPADPQQCYRDFKNWYIFLNLELPFALKNIPTELTDWRNRLQEFLAKAKGVSNKRSMLCRFVRQFIEKHQLASSPDAFLMQGQSTTINKFYREFLDQQLESQRERINFAVHEFIEWVLDTHLTDDDEETGERVRFGNARNPFRTVQVEPVARLKPSQTVRSLLPFYYLRKAREWVIPPDARHFRDLSHLYDGFDADWVPVDASQINQFDRNCVWKEKTDKQGNTQHFLWYPMPWLHLYSLMMTGLRGSMIAHCDSGEADAEIPDLDKDGKIFWVKNSGALAGLTKRQSVIARYPDDQVGLYTPRNKCGNGVGFYSPWMDEQLAYWLIQLRRWQVAYNPLSVPTPWTQLTRLRDYNEQQKKQKGVNCFLFRAFNDVQPASYPNRLKQCLAATLYHIQDDEIELATVPEGKERNVTYYQSDYTPHSLRGSFITALIIEGGLSPFIVMRLVGQVSIVTNSYYCKPDDQLIRYKIQEAEKKALQDQAIAKQAMIRQGRINELKQELICNDATGDLISSLTQPDSPVNPSSFMFPTLVSVPLLDPAVRMADKRWKARINTNPYPRGIWAARTTCVVGILFRVQHGSEACSA